MAVCLVLVGCSHRPLQTRPPGAEPGSAHFQSYCAACHQYDGQGGGEAPPLDDSPWVTGPQERIIKIVLHGVRGKMEVHGKTYNREMPGFGAILSDGDIASLLSYVRKRFGGPSEPITRKAVSRVRTLNQDRTEYWSVDELLMEP